ncbi:MAG: hypothetical protein WBP12_04755 [Candidatus Saccharimonas sp.]
MIKFQNIAFKKLVPTLLLVAAVSISSVGFAPKASALGCDYNSPNTGYNSFPVSSSRPINRNFALDNFCMISNNGRFKATFQSDGNFVIYQGNSPIWSSGTSGVGARKLVLQGDGNIVIYNFLDKPIYPWNKAVWHTNTAGKIAPTGYNTLIMQNDGNLVLYQGTYTRLIAPIWASGTSR